LDDSTFLNVPHILISKSTAELTHSCNISHWTASCRMCSLVHYTPLRQL